MSNFRTYIMLQILIGDDSMKFKLKDPGSAITHFIAMVMALLAAAPLLIKAAREPDHLHVIALSIFVLSMVIYYFNKRSK